MKYDDMKIGWNSNNNILAYLQRASNCGSFLYVIPSNSRGIKGI